MTGIFSSAGIGMTSLRLPELAARLLEKTRRGQVNWQHAPAPADPRRYAVNLLSAYLIVQSTDTNIELRIQPDLNDDREYLGELRVAPGEPGWDELRELFQAAQEKARGWGKILETIEAMIRSDEPIG